MMQYMQHFPAISVIIVAWNSKAYLHTCLDKLSVQTFRDFELILVDNVSENGALNGLHENYPAWYPHGTQQRAKLTPYQVQRSALAFLSVFAFLVKVG